MELVGTVKELGLRSPELRVPGGGAVRMASNT